MIKKVISIIVVFFILGLSVYFGKNNRSVDIEGYIFSNFENVRSVKKISENFYYLFDKKTTFGKPTSVLTISSADGYSGPIKIGVNYDQSGKIIAIEVLKQTETPGFFRRVERAKFKDQYIGRNIQEKFVLKRASRGRGPKSFQQSTHVPGEINAVSRATVSCVGINTAVERANAQTCSLYFKEKFESNDTGIKIQLKDILIILLFIYALLLSYSKFKILKKIRPIYHLVSVILLGFVTKGLLSITHFTNLILGNFPENQYYWYLVIGLFVFSILLLGKNLYFAHVCPMGIIQDYMAKIPTKKIKFKQKRYYQYPAIILTLGIIVYAIFFNLPGFFGHEIFSAVFSFDYKSLLFPFAILNLILALFIKRFWCRFLCPVGVIGKYLQTIRSIFVRKK